MKKNEINCELNEIKALAENLTADKGRKCKRFFEIIRAIEKTTEIISTILKKIEELEVKIENQKN